MLDIHLLGQMQLAVDGQPHRLQGLPKTKPLLVYLLLKRAAPAAPDDLPWVVVDSSTVQWNPAAPLWLDVAEFEAAARSPASWPRAVALSAAGSSAPRCRCE